MTPGRDPRTHQGTRRKNLILMGGLFGLVFGMIGLSFAAVPLYDLFCKVTGFGGTPMTGTRVFDAIIPGRCAAPPAPAMMTFKPRDTAVLP